MSLYCYDKLFNYYYGWYTVCLVPTIVPTCIVRVCLRSVYLCRCLGEYLIISFRVVIHIDIAQSIITLFNFAFLTPYYYYCCCLMRSRYSLLVLLCGFQNVIDTYDSVHIDFTLYNKVYYIHLYNTSILL